RSRTRPVRAPPASAGRAARVGARARALPVAAERAAQALGNGALGARALAVDAVRRDHARHRDDQADPRVAAARGAVVLALGAAEICGVPVPVPALGDLSPRAPSRDRAAAEARSADARLDLP